MKTKAKILICYNSPFSIYPVYNGKPADDGGKINDLSESGFANEIEKIKQSLQNHFTTVDTLPIDKNVAEVIKQINLYAPDIIFNFVESVEGVSSYEYCMTGLFELLGYNYTGNEPSTLGNCLNKARTKNILCSYGINSPRYFTVSQHDIVSEINFKLNFPVILKLLNEDASIGISEFSVVTNFRDFKKQLKFLFGTYNQPVIVEEFIEGRELNVAILGDKVLPISEIIFSGLPGNLPQIVTYDGKWIEGSVYYNYTKPNCPAKLDIKTKKRIESTALAAYHAMNCRDYARVDIRLDKKNIPYVIEVNPNPDISTDSGFARAAAARGLNHNKLLSEIIRLAMMRKKNDTQNQAV